VTVTCAVHFWIPEFFEYTYSCESVFVDVESNTPSPKSQFQVVGLPVVVAVKATVILVWPVTPLESLGASEMVGGTQATGVAVGVGAGVGVGPGVGVGVGVGVGSGVGVGCTVSQTWAPEVHAIDPDDGDWAAMTQLPGPPVSTTAPVNPAPAHSPAALFTCVPLQTRVGTTHRLPIGVGVGVAPTNDATSGLSTGAVAVLISVSEPPKKPPMKGVRNVKGWLTVTLTTYPAPIAKLVEATWQSTTGVGTGAGVAGGIAGAKQTGEETLITPPPLWP
jgi:hypothetical protein